MFARAESQVLGIAVTQDLLEAWCAWFAPAQQPFLVAEWDHDVGERRAAVPRELLDTFEIYDELVAREAVWLSEPEFMSLPAAVRRRLVQEQVERGRGVVPTVRASGDLAGPAATTQAGGRRFVWWPRLLHPDPLRVLGPYILEGRLPSRHAEVPVSVWETAERLLPNARCLAGRFPARSGPNCFGTVMAAAGKSGAEDLWMQREPFEDWLASNTVSGGRDNEPGTVLVWRSPDGLVQHAAVTLGAGFALHKPSQGWMSPTKVLHVAEVKASSRAAGRRLQRYRLTRTA